MKAQILKISGHKNEKDFYKEFPTMDAFMAKHGAAFKKAQYGYPTMQYPQPVGNDYTGMGSVPQQFGSAIGGNPNFGPQNAPYTPIPGWQKPGMPDNEPIFDPSSVIKPYQNPNRDIEQGQQITGDITSGAQDAMNKSFDTGKAIETGIGMVDSIIGGFGALKAEKKALKSARTWRDVSKLSRQASETEDVNARGDIADQAARTRKAIQPSVNTEEFFPQYGVGTNVLARDGGRFAQDGINNFAPGDIYEDLGYEPLGESEEGFSPLSDEDVVKAYRSGGLISTYQMGGMFSNMGKNFMSALGGGGGGQGGGKKFLGMGGDQWGSIAQSAGAIGSNMMGNNAGTQIGGGFGEAAGSLFGPVGGMVGKAVGSIAGGLFDKNPQKIARAQKDMMKNVNIMSGMNTVKDFRGANSGVFRTGGNMRQNSVGDIEAVSGGNLQPMSYNPYSDGTGITSMIKGQTHEESNGDHTGVLLNYNRAQDGSSEPQVEAENNEPITEIGEDAVIFGDIVINKATVGDDPHFKPFYGKTFKKAMEGVAEQNKKLNKQQAKNTRLLNDLDPKTPIDKLKLNSLTVNEQAIDKKYQFNDMIMKKAAAHQQIVNDEAERLNINSGQFSRNKLAPADNVARSGKMMSYADTGESIKPKVPIDRVKKTKALPDYRRGQHATGKLYGSVTQADVDKLKEENPWYDWDTFDINKAGDVRHFQTSFNKLAQKVGSKERLNEDDQFGEQTASARIDLGEDPTTPTTPAPPGTTDKKGVYETTPYNKYGWENLVAQAMPWFRKQPGEDLLGDQLAGEMFALSHNQVEPVQSRFLHPQLDVPYDISYQDRLNENQATFNQMQRAVGANPAALSSLAGQKYGADSSVLAEQFRANQAKKDQVYSGNRAILNQAQEKNLQIADQQYVRQAQAKSNTKAVTQEALNSISAKIGQNRLENRTLQTYANMFPDFSYDRNYRIRKTGAPTTFNMPVVYNAAGDITHVALYDENNKIYDYRPISEDESKEMNKKNAGKSKDTGTSATADIEEIKAANKRHGGLVKAFKNL